jgi:murein DD-endopeptidase MepM/ murein hydrolase activator NlpD
MSIKKIAAAALIFILPGLAPAADKKPAQPEILIEPAEAGQGEISIVTVKGVSGTVEGRFEGRKVYFNPSKDSLKAVVGIDLSTEPGKYPLEITVNGTVLSRTVTVVKKEYEVQRLTLPRDMVELSPENEARVEREAKKLRALWPKESARAWDGNFINPREGKIQGAFGLRRIINKIPKNPHSGVDVDADAGAEVRTPNGGVVILVDDQFYSGLSVIVDHGQGLYTMFFHLSKILVTQGRPVKKGDVVGLVGSTGRSTGPHLHWGVRMQGARVNPQELIKLRLE